MHACIESGKRILFVGSEDSDVHLLANEVLQDGMYWRANVGDVDRLISALHAIEDLVIAERRPPRLVKAAGMNL
jgi:hypothetical protein